MVSEMTRLLLLGPPAWAAVAAAAVGLARQSKAEGHEDIWEDIWLRGALCYTLLAIVQHVAHWVTAKITLAYDLRCGELTSGGWSAASKGQPCVVLVAEAQPTRGLPSTKKHLVGVLCVRLGGLISRATRPPALERRRSAQSSTTCCKRKAAKRQAKSCASLWHATVVPEARNRGAARLLLQAAEEWARQQGVMQLEAACLNPAAKSACWNMGFQLSNPWTGRLPLSPAIFAKFLESDP
eukprot:gb/GFBE01002551.1/.p1 GENE.gb/GFBE01002551.1/~~gb/GFBE01002551.1/.p1  ORF type:complete len:239 (+),score=42.97 gb/GFBE01002551.1/:1-717(+)